MTLGIITGQTTGRSGVTLMARLRGAAGQPVTQASLSSITWQLSDLTAGTVAGSGTFAVASSIFDALQQADPRWQADSALVPGPDGSWGYNFLATLGAALFPVATLAPAQFGAAAVPHLYQADVAFQPVSGERFTVSWQLNVVPVYA